MLKEAEQVLGYDLLQLCTEGPKEKLDDTMYAQVRNRSSFARLGGPPAQRIHAVGAAPQGASFGAPMQNGCTFHTKTLIF